MTEQLTEPQRQAVEHFEGPLMVLAGPGSGKTRVITRRIARLLERGVAAQEVLALTFTNKAAREMSERVDRLLGGLRVEVSTFHRFCARLLRQWPEQVGLRNNFTILDASDQVQLIRSVMKEVGFDATMHDPRRVLNRISRARNELVTAEQFRMRYEERIGDLLDAVVYEVFPEYELRIQAQNSVDFDALLLHVVDMLGGNEELREYLDLHFRFVLVDEYQDTNLAQYRIVQALSQHCPNLCVTGDPDQSIYGWRGARPENIVQFERDFSDTSIVSLDQNFRSTASIVTCADRLISHNPRRHRNPLHTDNEPGEPVKLRIFSDAETEADQIAVEIAERVRSGSRQFSDFAIFYRVNALSRPIETALSRHSVPFQVAAGYSFYERAEIRDLLGYLRLIENASDDVAFVRVVNRPARGIGKETLERLTAFARQQQIPLLAAAERADEISALTARSRRPLRAFTDLIQNLNEQSVNGKVGGLIERLISEIDYLSLWKGEDEEVDQDRIANVYELVSAARLYEESFSDSDDEPSLQGFLELASLTSEADNVDASKGLVTLMTMHAAKGLEFPCVYVVGVESGLIPHERAVQNGDPASFQEERRLLFVAVTRAMQELQLTQTRQRDFRGSRRYTISSPFVPEMPLDVVSDESVPTPAAATRVQDDHVIRAKRRYEAAQQKRARPALMSAADLERQQDAGDDPSVTEAGTSALSDTTAALAGSLLRMAATQAAAAAESSDSLTDSFFATGRCVRHPRYGRGVIVAATAGGSRETVTVRFEGGDHEETFVLGHSPLQPVGNHHP